MRPGPPPEPLASVGFVGKDRSGVLASDQLGGCDALVSVSRSEVEANCAPPGVSQGVDLRVDPSLGSPDALDLNALRTTEGVLVNLCESRVDRPELPNDGVCGRVEDLVTNPRLALGLPSSVDGGVRREGAQRPPRATFPHAEEHSEKDALGLDRRPGSPRVAELYGRKREVVINFFNRLALAASFGWMLMIPISNQTSLYQKYKRTLCLS